MSQYRTLHGSSRDTRSCCCSGRLSPHGEFVAGVVCPVGLGTVEVRRFIDWLLVDAAASQPLSDVVNRVFQSCTFGLLGKDERWCFDVCKVRARTLQLSHKKVLPTHLLSCFLQVWQVPSCNMSPSAPTPPVPGDHPLVPMNFKQLARKVSHVA